MTTELTPEQHAEVSAMPLHLQEGPRLIINGHVYPEDVSNKGVPLVTSAQLKERPELREMPHTLLTDPLHPSPEEEKAMTPIRKLSRTVSWYIAYQFRRAAQQHVTDLTAVWNETILTLAQFNIQLLFKNRAERGHDKITRYTFFVCNGTPRPMSSFRIEEDYVLFFKKVSDRLRVVLSQPFDMNKEFLNLLEPFLDFHNIDERIAAEERSRTLLEAMSK